MLPYIGYLRALFSVEHGENLKERGRQSAWRSRIALCSFGKSFAVSDCGRCAPLTGDFTLTSTKFLLTPNFPAIHPRLPPMTSPLQFSVEVSQDEQRENRFNSAGASN
jgi:hypothetical protein